MSTPMRVLALFTASWAVATAAAFAVISVLDPGALSGPDSASFIAGGALVAALLVPYGLGLLRVAERAAMRITAPSRILGAALLCALPCFGAVIILERTSDILTPVEAVAFAAAGVAVGIVVGAAYPWARGPLPRRRRRRPPTPREKTEPPAPAEG